MFLRPLTLRQMRSLAVNALDGEGEDLVGVNCGKLCSRDGLRGTQVGRLPGSGTWSSFIGAHVERITKTQTISTKIIVCPTRPSGEALVSN